MEFVRRLDLLAWFALYKVIDDDDDDDDNDADDDDDDNDADDDDVMMMIHRQCSVVLSVYHQLIKRENNYIPSKIRLDISLIQKCKYR